MLLKSANTNPNKADKTKLDQTPKKNSPDLSTENVSFEFQKSNSNNGKPNDVFGCRLAHGEANSCLIINGSMKEPITNPRFTWAKKGK